MQRYNLFGIILLVIALGLLCVWFGWLRPAPPEPTPTARPPTATQAPTATATLQPSPTATLQPSPTITQLPTATNTPTVIVWPTPTPQTILFVDTGWSQGYLHFRYGPSPRFLPIWPIGWLPEGTRLIFLDCAELRQGYPWLYVGWVDKGGQTHYGYVYSDYTTPVMCQEAE